MNDEKTEWVDYAKGIGIILVVFGHVIRGLEAAGMKVPYFTQIDTLIYSFHMPLFFFISGMFFLHSFDRRGPKGLVFSKIDTLIYPYILWSLCQGFIEVALSSHTNGNVTLPEVLSLWDPRAQFWFLYVLFCTFIMTTLFFLSFKKANQFIVLIISILAFYYQDLPQSLHEFSYVYQKFSGHWIYFVFGMLYQSLAARNLSISLRFPTLFYLISFILIQFIMLSEIDVFDQRSIQLLTGLISIMFIIELSKIISKSHFYVVYLIGVASMEIYLIHILSGSGARVVLLSLGIKQVYIHILIGTLVGIVFPLLFKYFCQRLDIKYLVSAPISQLIFKRKITQTKS